jgi:hypothetical protein
LLLLLAGPAAAQYMKITTDNPTDNTRLRTSGTTILTITLDTDHDKNASLQSCNSHTSANGCGSNTTVAPLDMFSYTLALKATGGTVTWGTFTPSDAAYTDAAPLIFNSTEIEINKARPSGTISPAGLNSIGTLPVTPLTGSPSIGLQIGAGALNPFGFGTGFGTDCEGFFFPNTYVVGDPADPCGATNGIAGDWFDWDGAGAGVDNTPPVLTVAPTASGAEGTPFSLTATATDADAATNLAITASGFPPDLTFSTIVRPSPASATISGTPGFNDAGNYVIHWTVVDGHGLADTQNTSLTIANTNRPPTLNPVANMTVQDGATADQTISGSDPDGDALTFSKVVGPTYMTVTTTSATTGNIHLVPGFSNDGIASATVQTSDGALVDSTSFTITVGFPDRAPTLNPIANMLVVQGGTADQAISGSDPDGDALTFSKVAGPTFMTVTTTSATTGNIHLVPGFSAATIYPATARASDGTLSNDRSFSIQVAPCDCPPVLNQPANMTVTEGLTADQTITGSDPFGAPLTFTKVAGPTFMTVTTVNGTTGNIHLAPGLTDSGTYSATIRASNGTLFDDKLVTITVIESTNRPPVLNPIANMTLPPGSTEDQTVTASDPDGDALTFSKTAGPTFMTVTTTSPTSGNVHLAPSPLESGGTFGATVTASDGSLSASRSFVIVICLGCQRAPVLDPVADMTVVEGMTADQTITATDADGNALIFTKVSGPIFMTVTTTSPGTGSATGNIHLAPGLADAGVYGATVRASDGSLTNDRSFTITALTSGNRCPTANPGGPYSGIAGVAVSFDGSASSDPDGNPLTYAWDFDASNGIGVDAVGAMPSHIYPAMGAFTVTLSVTDNGDGDPAQVCSASAMTTANIATACDATVFNGYDTIRLGSGKPFWFAYVQPASGCYANTDVITSSFVLKYAGRQIPAEATKTSIDGDKSGDGIQEIKVSWSKDNLRTLFTGTGLANGHNTVLVTVEANLVAGGKLSGTTQLDVVNNGNFTISAVAPNPLNPEATLTYTTTKQGPVRIDMFDIQGRLVRRLVDAPAMTAGTHDVKIDGRDGRGEKLPSGVYYIRGTSSEGAFKHLVTILK